MKAGDKVIFVDASDEQVNWGSNDDPRLLLEKDKIYEIEEVEVHSWHTKIYLVGIKGKFNSVHFEEAPFIPTNENFFTEMVMIEPKEYFANELTLTDVQIDRVYELYKKHAVLVKDLAPFRVFSIKYEFTSIGVCKILVIGDKSFIINEEELENL